MRRKLSGDCPLPLIYDYAATNPDAFSPNR
jgi:hypothetical protein